MVLSTSFAEPPSLTYGAPSVGWESVSSGYSYEPSVATTHYEQRPVGHISSEGAHIDSQLLETVKRVILQHEQSSGSSGGYIPRPSSSYGPPKSTYGPPAWQSAGWAPKVTNLWFDHPIQSHPAAYYVGKTSYATAHKGWQPSHTIVVEPQHTYGVPKW